MDSELKIGKKIRDLRNQMGLTQQELADRSELTKGYISQLERGQTAPSIATLLDILECLGTTPAEFFNDFNDIPVVYREEDYFEKVNEEEKNVIQWLVPNAQRHLLEPIVVRFEPGGSVPFDKPHDGEEFGYVLQGRIRLTLGENEYYVNKGESFFYEPTKKHRIEAVDDIAAKVLWVSTPPNF